MNEGNLLLLLRGCPFRVAFASPLLRRRSFRFSRAIAATSGTGSAIKAARPQASASLTARPSGGRSFLVTTPRSSRRTRCPRLWSGGTVVFKPIVGLRQQLVLAGESSDVRAGLREFEPAAVPRPWALVRPLAPLHLSESFQPTRMRSPRAAASLRNRWFARVSAASASRPSRQTVTFSRSGSRSRRGLGRARHGVEVPQEPRRALAALVRQGGHPRVVYRLHPCSKASWGGAAIAASLAAARSPGAAAEAALLCLAVWLCLPKYKCWAARRRNHRAP